MQLRLPIFTSKIKYYNLRIVPPEPVFDKVTELKRLFEFAYGKQPLSRSKPHITLASFKMNSKHQDALVAVFEKLSEKKEFKVAINGFNIFEASNTLFLEVKKNKAIEALHQDVSSLRRQYLNGKLKKFIIPDHPHMTISKTTGKKMLNDSLQYFRENNYSQQIDVGHLTLVSRPKHRTWDWEHTIKLS